MPAAIGIALALGLFGYLLSWTVQARSAAMLHEVGTDLEDPPAFVELKAVRETGAWRQSDRNTWRR